MINCIKNIDIVRLSLATAIGIFSTYGMENIDHTLNICQKSMENQLNTDSMFVPIRDMKINKSEAFEYYKLFADQGNSSAQNILGKIYFEGEVIPQDLKEAFKYFKLAADQKDSDAQKNLGLMYENGDGVDKNINEAVKYYKLSADQGNLDVQVKLGAMYFEGKDIPQDLKEAIKYLKLAADQGHLSAQYNLGAMYFEGKDIPQDLKEAINYLKLAADQGHLSAQCNLGAMYFEGKDIPQDLKEAIKYLKLAADQGHLSAQYNLGVMYFEEKGIPQNLNEAIKYLKLAADQGHLSAQCNLGKMYFEGKGIPQNLIEAIKYLKLAADQGHLSAQYNLGKMYFEGKVIPQDLKESFKYYKLAADQGHSEAQFNIGVMYGNGVGIDKNLNEAVKYYKLAAAQGDLDAQSNLGVIYCDIKNIKKAHKYLKLAADQGHPSAQINLGAMYCEGKDIPEDYNEAAKYFNLAADQGHPAAQYNLGLLYEKIKDIPHELKKSVKYYKFFADHGDSAAQTIVGMKYENGIGVDKNLKEAVKYYKLAVGQGHLAAQYNLALMYENGVGVDRSLKEAFKYFKLAADQGDSDAQAIVGMKYENGIGVDTNLKEAFKYFKLAANQGQQESRDKISIMYLKGQGVNQDFNEFLRYFDWIPGDVYKEYMIMISDLQKFDKNKFNEIIAPSTLVAFLIKNNAIVQEATKSYWSKNLKSEDENVARKFVNFICYNHIIFGLPIDDYLVQNALEVGINLQDIDDIKNPYKIFRMLQENRKAPISIDLESMSSQTLCGLTLSINPKYLKGLNQKITPMTFKDLPFHSKDFLSAMDNQIKNRLIENKETLMLIEGVKYDDLSEESLGDSYLKNLLSYGGEPDDLVPETIKKLIAVIAYIEGLNNDLTPNAFSQRENEFIMMLSSIQECPWGKDAGIDDCYHRLPKSAQYNEMNFLDNIIYCQVKRLFDGENDWFRKLTKTPDNEENVYQAIHQGGYAENLIGHEVGISKASSPPKFDKYTNQINDNLLELSQEELFHSFYEVFLPKITVNAIVTETNKEMEKTKSTLGTQLCKDFGHLSCWKECFVEDDKNISLNYLTEYGAVQFLIELGALIEKK